MKSSSRSLRRFLLALAIALPTATAIADTIYVRTSGGSKSFALHGTVNKIAKNDVGDELLYYTNDDGRNVTKILNDVVRLDIENEPLFSQAEKEFQDGNLEAAGKDYRKAMATSGKDWIKHRADLRLVGISAKTGDFNGAVAGFVEMTRNDPSVAAKQKPDISAAKPEQLDAAIAAVQHGLSGSKPDVQLVLLPFLADLQTKKGDSKAAAATLDRLQKLSANASATIGRDTNSQSRDEMIEAQRNAKESEAKLSLSSAEKALGDKQYDVVIKTITDHKAVFIDPEKQAQALYLIAQAKEASATTPDALADAAIAYMRVVANFKLQPNSPAADALYKTATIDEKLQKPNDALLIYKQVISEFKDTKAAQDAQAAVSRIQASRG